MERVHPDLQLMSGMGWKAEHLEQQQLTQGTPEGFTHVKASFGAKMYGCSIAVPSRQPDGD